VTLLNPSFEDLKKEITKKGIHLSHQRLKVFEYLYNNQCHPTADEIFTNLQMEISTLSKTTVYNTLKILSKAGLIRTITIEDNEIRYDIIVENHGHFKCENCGSIFNFSFDVDLLKSDDLKNFRIDNKSVYFKGICPRCL
jgi:Fur family peroxide stress response transcriptional regulator